MGTESVEASDGLDDEPWFRRRKPNGDPEPTVAKGVDGTFLILDSGVAFSFQNGNWSGDIRFSHDQIAEMTPVKERRQVYEILREAERAVAQSDPTN